MERKKGDFPYESSLGGVRLMTSPYKVSSCTVQTNKYLDRVAKAHKFSN